MANTPIYADPNSAIIERCQTGQEKAFYELYALYAKAMLNVSLRILNDTAEAEDVLQESFVKVFQNIGDYDPNYSFGSWLKKIVINRSLDVLRKRKVILVPLDAEQHIQEEENDEEIVYEVETIKKCMAQLPDGYRTILSLYLFEDHTHKEIGELLGIHEGTSKSQYNRAKKKLIELVKHTSTHER
jgi:RNA polymerase sigma factor (sigma-70 family)